MKKLFTLLLIAGAPMAAMAQPSTFSIGMRGGVSSMTRIDNQLHGDGKTVACQTELFGRFQIKRWALEGTAGYSHYNSGPGTELPAYSGIDYRPISEHYSRKGYQFTLNAQYALFDCSGCCHGQSCNAGKFRPRFRNYVGLAVSHLTLDYKIQGESGSYFNSDVTTYEYSRQSKSLWAGPSNTLVLDVCPKVQVSGGFQWLLNLERGALYNLATRSTNYQASQYPSSQLLFQLGAGFKL